MNGEIFKMEKPKFLTLNLNTVLSGVAVLLVYAAITNGWKLNEGQVAFKITQDNMVLKQDAMAKQISDLIPRVEYESRLKGIETTILEIKVRLQASELEIIKFRDARH